MTLITLYSYHLPYQLSLTNHGAPPHLNRPMYNYPQKVYKNNYNIIDLVVRDNDRKPVRLIDAHLQVIVSNQQTGLTVLEKPVQVTDEIQGRAQMIITASETENWTLGGYQFNVKLTDHHGRQEFLYVDINNQIGGTFELLPSVGGDLVPAQTILGSAFTPTSYNWDTNDDWYVSGALVAENPVGAHQGNYTIAVYTNLWQGTFRIQASLQNLAPTERSWFWIPLVAAQPDLQIDLQTSSVFSLGFTVNAQWIRFMYKPHPNNLGSFDKVVYKII